MAEAQLLIEMPDGGSRSVPLHPGIYRIGRGTDCEVQLELPTVSRRHALLERQGRHWLLRDEQSTNGLWWQGHRVRELVLRDGDCVRCGPEQLPDVPQLRFQEPGQARTGRGLRLASLTLAGLAAAGLASLALAGLLVPIRGSLAPIRGPLALYDRGGKPIATAEGQRHRELDRLDGYPPVLIHALLASEDTRFWWHPGVDPIGTGRALLANLVGGRVLEGGSTLTQQLARSLYPDQVGQGENLGRKIKELLVSLQLEARFSKRDLLLSYLNRVYLGAGWGFEDASRHFFGKPARRLQLPEAALLVGLLPSPNGYDPCIDPQAALDARNRVLAKMRDTGRISADAARRSRRSPVQLSADACRGLGGRRGAPFYSDQVRRDLAAQVGADVAAEGNFLVDTHLDPALQATVERVLRQRINNSTGLAVSEGAVVVIDARTGGILAVAGGRDYSRSQFNRATMALRQPGSTFKIFSYLAALERGRKLSDAVACGPLQWRGQTFSSGCGGSLSLLSGFAVSSNTVALRLARQVGLDAVVRKARDLGITSPLAEVPGLALGQSEVTLLELTGAYAAVANGGTWHPPSTIRRVVDGETCQGENHGHCRSHDGSSRSGRAATTPVAGRRVMLPAVAGRMQELLRAVVRSGTGTAAAVGGREGGKTGTTNDNRDLLFVGFEPSRQWVIGIWLGNDENAPTRGSSAMAAALWSEIIRASGG